MNRPGILSPLLLNRKRSWLACSLLLGLALMVLLLASRSQDMKPMGPTPMWRGIVPGRTTQFEVLSILGRPDGVTKCQIWLDTRGTPEFVREIRNCFSPLLTYKYKEVRILGKPPATHEIRFRFLTVSTIVEDMWLSPDESSPPLLKRFVKDYGPPEKVTWSRLFPHLRAFLFCEHGVMVHANDVRVSKVFYFAPTTLDQCLQAFSNEVATEDPFPDSDVITGPENPWPWLIPNE